MPFRVAALEHFRGGTQEGGELRRHRIFFRPAARVLVKIGQHGIGVIVHDL
jgi:hypothetical protein